MFDTFKNWALGFGVAYVVFMFTMLAVVSFLLYKLITTKQLGPVAGAIAGGRR